MQYKHKHTGQIVTKGTDGLYHSQEGGYTLQRWIFENSNDWEEVKEGIGQEPYIWKLYEPKEELNYLITSFKSKNHHMKINQDGSFGNLGWTLESMLKDKDYEIFSVKNSKGEEFILSETVKFSLIKLPIIKFEILSHNNEMCVILSNGNRYSLCSVSKVKSPIYTTTDGKEIYEGEYVEFYLLDELTIPTIKQPITVYNFKKEDSDVASKYLTFASEENRDKYIKENSKKLIFVSADGKEMYEGEFTFSVLSRNTWEEKRIRVNSFITAMNKDWIHFRTKEARQEYIDNNKPKYSLSDIEKCYPTPFGYENRINEIPLVATLFQNLKKLSK